MSEKTIAEWAMAQARDDAQEFMQVINLGANMPTVWFRIIGGDFMPSCQVRRPGNKNWRTIEAIADGRAECLEQLAANVAAYLYPPSEVQ